jgi:hypothetical protein
MRVRSFLVGLAVAGLVVTLAAPMALAAPDVTDSVVFTNPDGAFSGVKTVKIYADSNPEDPFFGDGKFTFVYSVTNDVSSFLPIIGVQIQLVPGCEPSTIGFFPGPGLVDPDAPGGTVGSSTFDWNFTGNSIAPGATSSDLYVTSACGPSVVEDLYYSVDSEGAFVATGLCLGPAVMPMEEEPGEAMPCTIGFWKNRFDGKKGTTQWFPDGDVTAVLNAATALCSPPFTSSADLLTYLQSSGPRSILTRGKQQLAAFCLNLAAGDLFRDNVKCKLFEGNFIVTNACGQNITVGNAFTQVLSDIQSGLPDIEHDAHDCTDDVNNGISVINNAP